MAPSEVDPRLTGAERSGPGSSARCTGPSVGFTTSPSKHWDRCSTKLVGHPPAAGIGRLELMHELTSKVAGGLLILVAVAVVARVVFGLLWSLLPAVIVLLVLGSLVGWVLRGPRSGGGLFHK